jgi:hypothetical protein
MNRDELQARFTEMLIQGGEPMDVPEIRDAVAADPELGKSLDEFRSFIGKFDDMQWPQLDERRNIRYMTRAFEEGFHQGRTFAALETAQSYRATGRLHRWWRTATVAATAVFVGLFAGTFAGKAMNPNGEIDQLRADVRGLRETVAISLLENHSASQRLRGLQWSQQVTEPGDRLITELSETLRRDSNVNVRLAAADAMSRFTTIPRVRNALYQTVLEERDPLVQVHLIDVMVITGGRDAPVVLERLLEKRDITDVVRDKATVALTEMSDL